MTSHPLFKRLLFIACLSFGVAQTVSALEVAKVKVDETATVANQELKLNGAGVRTKVFFKVYVAALYLTEKKSTPAEILAQPGPKRVQISFLREVSSDSFGQGFMDGLGNNSTAEEKSKIFNQIVKLGQLFGKVPEVNKGDVLTIDWIPASGTVVQLNGKQLGDAFPDVNFYNALLKIWLGEKPVDASLKKHFLNEKE